MKIEVDTPAWLLREGHPLRLQGARGVTIHCLSGRLWLTTAGQADDIFLHPGQCHTVDAGGLTLIEALGQAQARLETPAPCRKRLLGQPPADMDGGLAHGLWGLPQGSS